jgi:hypothetical protein
MCTVDDQRRPESKTFNIESQQLMQFHCGRLTTAADGNPFVDATATKPCIEQNHIKWLRNIENHAARTSSLS